MGLLAPRQLPPISARDPPKRKLLLVPAALHETNYRSRLRLPAIVAPDPEPSRARWAKEIAWCNALLACLRQWATRGGVNRDQEVVCDDSPSRGLRPSCGPDRLAY